MLRSYLSREADLESQINVYQKILDISGNSLQTKSELLTNNVF